MRKVFILLTLFEILTASYVVAASAVRISQVYAGSANLHSTTPYNADFVELFNSSGSPIDIGGWMLAYGTSNPTSSFGCPGCTSIFPASTTISPCSYLLIQTSVYTDGSGASLPSIDVNFSTGPKMSGVGTLALLSAGAASGQCVSGPNLADLVGWGPVSCHEGASSAPAIPQDYAILRNTGGVADTDLNVADFSVAPPSPRNSGAPQNTTCLGIPALGTSWGRLKFIYR
jgi:hypothetical protein